MPVARPTLFEIDQASDPLERGLGTTPDALALAALPSRALEAHHI